MASVHTQSSFKIEGPQLAEVETVLNKEAIAFIIELHKHFQKKREDLLAIRSYKIPHFLEETREIRLNSNWHVAVPPRDLQKRTVEITGPTDKKMLINALNSGANAFMADFEDANSPTWTNLIEGQANLTKAIAGTLTYESPEGKKYTLNQERAVLMVRPRGWHLYEKHFLIDQTPLSGSLFDFALYFYNNVDALISKGTAPYFYLPKLESHYEARLWNEVFDFSEKYVDLPQGTIRATVLIETLPAAFEMDEILWELRTHITGLNAGRWDYLFSVIKNYSGIADSLLPDRGQVTMEVPFMEAYAQLLVETCNRRHAQPIGGMAAFVPSRKNPEVNAKALDKVRNDKKREFQQGFVGTWVAHPDLVDVAKEEFLRSTPSHSPKGPIPYTINENEVTKKLLDFTVKNGTITEQGIRQNISISLEYVSYWLEGIGAVALHQLMEDTATAEISRSQLWQWIHHQGKINDQTPVTRELILEWIEEEYNALKSSPTHKKLDESKKLLIELVKTEPFINFLTTIAYPHLEENPCTVKTK